MDMMSSLRFVRALHLRELERLEQPHPRALNIILAVSGETYERTVADSVRPSAESRHTMGRSDWLVARDGIGRVWVKIVDMG
jgi:hypothetical protein